MSFETFTFKPSHQPDPDQPVEFNLRPLDNPTLFRLLNGYGSEGGLQFEDLLMVRDRCVVGWKGLPQEFSPEARRALLAGPVADFDAQLWIGQCARELYHRAVLKEVERKN
jgi:hypothetical protein